MLLRMAEIDGTIRGVRVVRGAPRVNHLLFANYSLIFGDVTTLRASNALQILQSYANCFGQLVNFNKSSVLFSSNVSMENRLNDVRIFWEVCTADKLEKYLGFPCIDLGFPCMVGRDKKHAFASLRDKIHNRISS